MVTTTFSMERVMDLIAARTGLDPAEVRRRNLINASEFPYKNALGSADAELTPEQLKFIQDHGSGVLSDEFYSWLVEESAKTLKHAMAEAGVALTEVPGALAPA